MIREFARAIASRFARRRVSSEPRPFGYDNFVGEFRIVATDYDTRTKDLRLTLWCPNFPAVDAWAYEQGCVGQTAVRVEVSR